MKKLDQNKLRKEFKNYLTFWTSTMFNEEGNFIFPEASYTGEPNSKTDMGSMYIGRILYGATRAFRVFPKEEFKLLADTAFNMLLEFKNRSGGYHWARKYNMEWVHDPENNNMAQAFVLYGLAEYVHINNSATVKDMLQDQLDFIFSNIQSDGAPYFLDGFDQEWARGEKMTYSFGSHFHMMEALVLIYKKDPNSELKDAIQDLIRIIIKRFISDEYACLHRYNENWELLPNQVWPGHNAECCWVLCDAAIAIKDEELIAETQDLAVKMMDEVLAKGKDNAHDGYFNAIEGSRNLVSHKSWWPQAEVVLGLMNVFKITGNTFYQEQAIDQIQYISDHFVSDKGEWFADVDEKGVPIEGTPLVFFWKSMYHIVRYYDYLLNVD